MWDENERFVESTARTNKLWCSTCRKRIPKGSKVVFLLDTVTEKMKEVYCSECEQMKNPDGTTGHQYEVASDVRHPFDLEE